MTSSLARHSTNVETFIALWLGGVAATSAVAYRSTINDFAKYLDRPVEVAIATLLEERGRGHALALAYRAFLLEKSKAPATINVRLAALRSLVSFARKVDLVDWTLDVPGVKAQSYRDTRGPGRAGFKALLSAASGPRDRAILWLLFGLALRRGELASLDLEHVAGDRLLVKGKGSRERIPLTIPPAIKTALSEWIALRGDQPGPLFPGRKGTGMHVTAYNSLIKNLARKAGLEHVRPHGLRHAAITEALELSGGNMRSVARFSRHADVRVIGRYDDNRTDLGGEIANAITARATL